MCLCLSEQVINTWLKLCPLLVIQGSAIRPGRHLTSLLTALAQKSLDGRVAEALPWVAANSAELNSWLVENARKFNLQNRLGFVVSLARRAADKLNVGAKATALDHLRLLLDDSRLAKEDYFYRPPRTES
jgi:hypothetical protein